MQKRERTLTCLDQKGETQMVMTGMFSLEDIRRWSEKYQVLVTGLRRGGRKYKWCIERTEKVFVPHKVALCPSYSAPPHHQLWFWSE